MVRDHQRPHRDSWSFDPKPTPSLLARPSLAKDLILSPSASELDGQPQPTPTLPERIVVRRASFVPSWIDDQRLRALPARLSALRPKPPPLGSSPLAQQSSAYIVPSPGVKEPSQLSKVGESDRPVLYIRTQMVPPRPGGGGESVGRSEGVSTMLFPESVRMSDGSMSGENGGLGEGGRVLFSIEESPPPVAMAVTVAEPDTAVAASPASAFAQPLVPLAVLRQMSEASLGLRRKETGSTLRAVQPSPSVYSGPNSSLGHGRGAERAVTAVSEPGPVPRAAREAAKVPQIVAAFESASSPSAGSVTKLSPPNSDTSPLTVPVLVPSAVQPLRITTQSSAARPVVLQPATDHRPDEVVTVHHHKRPQPTPLAQPHLSVESLAAEVDRGSGSTESGISILSTSRFPSPPPVPSQRGQGHSTEASRSGSVVTEEGMEFELVGRRGVGVGGSVEGGGVAGLGARAGREALNVTSFVVGRRGVSSKSERATQAETAERQDSGLAGVVLAPRAQAGAGASSSPGLTEFLTNQARATAVPPTHPTATPASSTARPLPPRQPSALLVEAQGRPIPPRPGFLARTLAGYAASAPARPAPPGPPPRSGLPLQPRRVGPASASVSESDASEASLLESFGSGSRDETPMSSANGAGVPFRMFEQPRTPPLHLIREDSEEGSKVGEGEVERVGGIGIGVTKGR